MSSRASLGISAYIHRNTCIIQTILLGWRLGKSACDVPDIFVQFPPQMHLTPELNGPILAHHAFVIPTRH